jgi:hypothetical protein
MRDWMANTFGQIIEEAREELITRGWFSRNFSPRSNDEPALSDLERPIGEQLGWDHPGPASPGHDIDR